MSLGSLARRLAALLLLAPLAPLASASCAQGGDDLLDTYDEGDAPGQGTQSGDVPDSICMLHSCNADAECAGCSDGRTTCLTEEHRCVACDAASGTGCPEGESCSSWGTCVPDGATCPTDNDGTPLVHCASSADCVACDPMHQVCDTTTARCVACTASDTSSCQSTDICLHGDCSAKCPSSCGVDNDCAQCGAPGHEAHACNAHECAQCSDTYACPAGQACSPQGVCVEQCGSDGQGACASDADCAHCGDQAPVCHKAINDPVGTCGPDAAGCSDLGGIALPDPWSQVTNLCSNDQDCAGVGVTYNVGQMLRDATGFNQIGDANITYSMASCASVTVGIGGNDVSCGLCVPCKVDSDCANISLDQVSGDLFGQMGQVAADFLLEQMFGPNDHTVHMYCDPVAGGYGVCAPCPGLLYECGVGQAPQSGDGGQGGNGGDGGGTCDHDACSQGGPLAADCDTCAGDVCAVDQYCCDTAWDGTCVNEASQYCNAACQGGGQPANCHDECTAGDALDAACSSCAGQVCGADAYCCDNAWDATCVNEADQMCGGQCGGNGGNGGASCGHDECSSGDALDPSCGSCASDVCASDAYCCDTAWDATCVNEADQICNGICGGNGGNGGSPQCSSEADCPWPQGCLSDGTCGSCWSDSDCSPYQCDWGSGQCY